MISRTETEPHGREGKAITMAMVAKAAGVSQGAISSLLNDRDYGIRVSAKTREKVFRICREMGYLPNDLRAIVRMYPERGDLYLLLDESAERSPLVDHLIQALLRLAPGHHIGLALYDPHTNYSDPEHLPEAVRGGVASQFITLGAPCPSLFTALAAREFAVVHLGEAPGNTEGISLLVPDYRAAAGLALSRLFEHGHRQITILSGPFGSTAPEIVALNHGVRETYEALGVPIEAHNILYGGLTFEHGASAVDLLWKRATRPTALFCFSDLIAAGAIHRAQELGTTIPADLSVIGCGDAPFAPWLHPPLTTIGFPAEQMARMALEAIHQRIGSGEYSRLESRAIPPVMIERSTCNHPVFE